MKIKNSLLALLATSLFFPLIGCNKNAVTWDISKEKLDKAQHLDTHLIDASTDLVFTLSKDNVAFKPDVLSKDAILLLADFDDQTNMNLSVKNDASDEDIDINKVLAKRFTDYTYSLSEDNKTLRIDIPAQYKNGSFSAFINHAAMSDNNYAESSQVFIPVEMDEVSIYPIQLNSYFLGQKDPTFYFEIYNTDITTFDQSKVTFSGGFKDLSIKDIEIYYEDDCSYITITTTGAITKSELYKVGAVNFKSNAFVNLKSDAIFTYDILGGSAYVDPTQILHDTATKALTTYISFSSDVGELDVENFKLIEPKDGNHLTVYDVKVDEETLIQNTGYYVTFTYDYQTFEEAMARLRNSSMQITDASEAITYDVTFDFAAPTFYTILNVGPNGKYYFDIICYDGFINDDSSEILPEDVEFVNYDDSENSPKFTRSSIEHIYPMRRDGMCYGYEITTNVSYDKDTHFYTSGNLIIHTSEKHGETPFSIKYRSYCNEQFTIDNLSTLFSFDLLEIYKKANGRNRVNPLNEKSFDDVYSEVMQTDDFHWQYGAKAGLNLAVIGGLTAAAISGSGEAAASLVSMGLEIIDGLLDASLGFDPIKQLFSMLGTISAQIEEVRQNLVAMRSEMHEMHDEIYNGISRLHFISEQSSWSKFCETYVLRFDRQKVAIRTNVSNAIYKLFKDNDKISLSLYLPMENEAKETPYAAMIPSYSTSKNDASLPSIDHIDIDPARTINIEIDKNSFKNTADIIKDGYTNEFIKVFRKDLSDRIALITDKKFPADCGLKITTAASQSSFEKYYDYCHKDTEVNGLKTSAKDNLTNAFAGDVVKALMSECTKKYFTNDSAGKKIAHDFALDAIDFYKTVAGKVGIGVEKAYMHFYKMMYDKYSFQNEAMPTIKRFRVWLKQIMFSYASFAKAGLDLYDDRSTVNELKEAYQSAVEDFCKNDGLRDVKKDVLDKNPKIFTADYCYVTNQYLTMDLIRNRTTDWHSSASKPKECQVGISSRNYRFIKDNASASSGTFVQLNDSKLETRLLPYVTELKIKHIIDRARYNGNLKDKETSKSISIEQYFVNCKVLSKVVQSEHAKFDNNHHYLMNSYGGAGRVGRASDYRRNVTVYCHTKLAEKMHYFDIGGAYNINKDPHDKDCDYGTIYKSYGKVWDMENTDWQNPTRDNLGHVYWHFQSHWYWSTDEIWGFQEFKDNTYYYALLAC